MKISLVLLTFNEIDGVRALLEKVPLDSVDEAFAVDGGSTDGTREFYARHHFRVVEQTSRGRGEAFRIAFATATGDALIFFSPDGNEDPADIPKFRPLLEQGYDMVIASRMMKGARNEEDHQRFKWRKWANQAFGIMANLTWNRRPFITDTINGYRAITRNAWEQLRPDGPGYTIEYQSSIRAFKRRLYIAEFPTTEGARIGGQSKAHSIPTGLRFVKLYLRELFLGQHFNKANK
ncbi:MAG: putative glycosyltransferase [Phycisphaerae bacterium]|nr:putative glycosyltransferase [Phycisphaerae bacterium]